MNATTERIMRLSDSEVLRVALWLFDQEREERRDELASARLKDLTAEKIRSDFNDALRTYDLGQLEGSPDPAVIVGLLRDLLIARAEEEPGNVAEIMRGLGMEAGGELLDPNVS
jgi:hypothetical protein